MRLTNIHAFTLLAIPILGCGSKDVYLGQIPEPAEQTSSSGSGASNALGAHKVKQVATGWYHACALLENGTVRCWGNNYGGMLGDGTQTDHLQPQPVLGLSGRPISIAASYTDSCAVYADGTAQCWGSNNYGQLGDGTTTTRTLPVDISIADLRQLSLGQYHSCALQADASVSCWGYNLSGALGLNVDQVQTPTNLENLGQVRQISAGGNLSCALLSNQRVSCWGQYGGSNNCNPGPALPSRTATVPTVANATQVSAGEAFACALISDGTVSCWGANDEGQLGVAATTPSCTDEARGAARVQGISAAKQIAAGGNHVCALLKSGQVACWGRNAEGQLGDGTTIDRPEASLVVGIDNAIQISAGYSQTCAVLADHSLSCWGNLFQLGDMSHPPPEPLPQTISF